MSSGSVEERIMQLEQKVRQLESNARPETNAQPWWECVAGAFVLPISTPSLQSKCSLQISTRGLNNRVSSSVPGV